MSRRQTQGANEVLVAALEAAQRSLAKVKKQEEKLPARFRESGDDGFPWELVEREIKRAEKEKQQLRATVAVIERRIDERHHVLGQLDTLTTSCERVRNKLDSFDFDQKWLAREALVVKVTRNGRDWKLEGSIPTGDGVTYQTPRHSVSPFRYIDAL